MTTEDPVVTKSMLDATLKKALDMVDLRFAAVEFNVKRLEEKVDRGFMEMNQKFDHIINVLDTFMGRLNDKEVNDVARCSAAMT